MPKISDITYPVFRIKGDIETTDNITYSAGRVLDNLNFADDTLAKRRLRYTKDELTRLGETYFSLADVNKHPGKTRFIDSLGVIFKLNKKTFYRINYYKVTETKYTEDMYLSYVRCEGIRPWVTIKSLTCPQVDSYLGLIEMNGGYIPYEISDEKLKTIRRKL